MYFYEVDVWKTFLEWNTIVSEVNMTSFLSLNDERDAQNTVVHTQRTTEDEWFIASSVVY